MKSCHEEYLAPMQSPKKPLTEYEFLNAAVKANGLFELSQKVRYRPVGSVLNKIMGVS